ncbi:MAG: efflux RND transporter periplasmic adaptor subunit [Deltaproteobacteria bacterium]|nr:MAG: efflux RND transporter periplasmic adaptor subunit [Deltaproteobacteria bacterium]
MHPEIVSNEPGRCPICDMALVPVEENGAAPSQATARHNASPVPAPAPSAAQMATAQTAGVQAAPGHAGGPSEPKAQPATASGRTGGASHRHGVPSSEEATGAAWTCPMHPQIVESQPGTCPICGMDLVPVDTPATQKGPERKIPGERKILYWVAPMDPSYRSDKPGKSPMGMDLVPVYEGGNMGSVISVDPVVVQNMGVRIALVQRGRIWREVRTVGQVEVAEDRLTVVNPRFSGWVERIHVDETGVRVRAGEPLVDVYSPELVSAQEEYLLALRTSGPGSALAKSARRRLQLFGVPTWQIDRVQTQREVRRTLTVVAPRAGYVVHKNVVEGARIQAGSDIYRIADLSRVWVEAEVYEYDAPYIQVGAEATVELTFQPGTPRRSRVDYIYPTLNPKSRTLRVRVELENPDLALKPGMFATVDIHAEEKKDALWIPTEAVIHSGRRELVFVALDLGHYEPREIATGLVGAQYRTEVVAGLHEGERVVTSGQFLLDSESQLQEAVQKMIAGRLHAKEPRPEGGTLGAAGEAKDGRGHTTLWTCPMHPEVLQDEPGTCPICGMDLVPVGK